MNLNRIGIIILGALAMTVIIFIIEINFYNDIDYTKSGLNEILLWSFIKGLVISLAVNIGNHIRLSGKNKNS